MKKILLMIALSLGLASCGGRGEQAVNESPVEADGVEVIYFHGKQRCASCKAIEQYAREVVETTFADEVRDGKVTFRIVDITTPEGEALADNYEVTWSSLYVTTRKDGKEERRNLTDFAFANALGNPDNFKSGLADAIQLEQ